VPFWHVTTASACQASHAYFHGLFLSYFVFPLKETGGGVPGFVHGLMLACIIVTVTICTMSEREPEKISLAIYVGVFFIYKL